MKKHSLILISILLVSCGEVAPAEKTAKEVVEPAKLLEIAEVVPGTMFATFDGSNGYDAMQNAAKDACGDEEICKVIMFPPNTILPTKFPMTDREVEQVIGNYTLNRNSGMDELSTTCSAVPNSPPALCSAD